MNNSFPLALAWLAAWGMTYWLHSTLLSGAVWLTGLRVRAPQVMGALWKVALVVGLLTATAQMAGRAALPQLLLVATPTEHHAIALDDGQSATVTPDASVAQSAPHPVAEDKGAWLPLFGALWGIVALAGCARLAWAYYRLYRRIGRREIVQRGALQGQLAALCERAGAPVPVLTLTAAQLSPMTLPNGEICLPRALLDEMPPAEQRAVLAHELAHLIRGDHHWIVAFQLLGALFPFQLLNHVARREFVRRAEAAADAYSVALMGSPLPLAQSLARTAAWLRAPASVGALVNTMFGHRSTLLERVERILQGDNAPPSRLRAGWVALLLGVALLFIAPPFALPTFAEGVKSIPAESRESSPAVPPRATPRVRVTPEPLPVARMPVEGVITVQPSRWHMGIDIAGEVGTPIIAAWDGTVISAGYDRTGYGDRVLIRHANGYETLYAHLDEITVAAQDIVEAGDVIGTRGESGNTTGPTLHFEVRRYGARVNPWNYLP